MEKHYRQALYNGMGEWLANLRCGSLAVVWRRMPRRLAWHTSPPGARDDGRKSDELLWMVRTRGLVTLFFAVLR